MLRSSNKKMSAQAVDEADDEKRAAKGRQFEALKAELLSSHGSFLPLRLIVLEHAEKVAAKAASGEGSGAEEFAATVALADELIAMVDQSQLAAAFGTSIDKADKAATKARKEDDKTKATLIAALRLRAAAQCSLVELDGSSDEQLAVLELKARIRAVNS